MDYSLKYPRYYANGCSYDVNGRRDGLVPHGFIVTKCLSKLWCSIYIIRKLYVALYGLQNVSVKEWDSNPNKKNIRIYKQREIFVNKNVELENVLIEAGSV